jgi:hypothetical protein
MTEFTVVADNLALPRGARFKYRPRFPIETGAICLLTIGKLLTIGGYYHNIAGSDWILQPDLIIRVTGKVNIEIWGLVEPLDSADGFDPTMMSNLMAAGAVIIETYDLLTPIMA